MRAVIQRVSEASVTIENPAHCESIGKGLVVLLAVKEKDTIHDVNFVADKCVNLRVFEDENDKMNLSLKDVAGEMLIISQFTLYGDTRKGNRPSFTDSAKPIEAEALYKSFIERIISNIGQEKVRKGIFGAMMQVKIINEGPVTLIVESK